MEFSLVRGWSGELGEKVGRVYLKSKHIEGEGLETSMDYHEKEEFQTRGDGA